MAAHFTLSLGSSVESLVEQNRTTYYVPLTAQSHEGWKGTVQLSCSVINNNQGIVDCVDPGDVYLDANETDTSKKIYLQNGATGNDFDLTVVGESGTLIASDTKTAYIHP